MTPVFPKAIEKFIAHITIREYAAHSYLYEVEDESIISDRDFDMLCKWMFDNFEMLKPHDINNYINKDDLEAGTGMKVARKISGQTKEYALSLIGKAKWQR